MEALEGDTAGCLLPCTASERETCQIVTKLVGWRTLLLGSKFEIREEFDAYCQLCIVIDPFLPQTVDYIDKRQLPPCSELLESLLTTHRCIGSLRVDLSDDESTSVPLLRTACRNKWIKTVSLTGMPASTANTISDLLPCLTQIEKLTLTSRELSLDAFLAPLCALLHATSSLKTLRLSVIVEETKTINTLFATLSRKPIIRELHFHTLELDCDPCLPELQQYLGSTTVLRALSVCTRKLSIQTAVLEGLLANRSVENFSLLTFIGNEGSGAMVSRIIRENSVIRKLIILCAEERQRGLHSVCAGWLLPLIENDTLEEVQFSLSMMPQKVWSALLHALPAKENLKTVCVNGRVTYSHFRWFYTEMKRSGSGGKVHFGYTHLTEDAEMLHYDAFLGADLSIAEGGEGRLAAALQLKNCRLIRSLDICIDSDHMKLSSALAEYLESTTGLRRLGLRVRNAVQLEADSQNPWWTMILKSLSRNKSVKVLSVGMCGMNVRDIQDLAESIKRNKYMTDVQFAEEEKADAVVFFRRLAEGIGDNYTLTEVRCSDHPGPDAHSDWLAVQETTWRNFGFVVRAGRVKRASRLDRYVTGALERVVRYPSLMDEVSRRSGINREQLEVLMRGRLKKTKSMDGFMRVTGVVKERVICHPASDGRMQLDELNEDCWYLVRRYLTADDVKHGTVKVDSV